MAIIIVLPYLGLFFVYKSFNDKSDKIENSNLILISKQEMRLYVFNYKGEELCKFPIACGLNYGNKEKVNDMKTPEGVFRISQIQKSDSWSHDFNDGNGEVVGSYGPYFIRLSIPGFSGIGIHGTNDPTSLDKRITEGCIRLQNNNLLKLVPLVHTGTLVIITTSNEDLIKHNL